MISEINTNFNFFYMLSNRRPVSSAVFADRPNFKGMFGHKITGNFLHTSVFLKKPLLTIISKFTKLINY